MDEKLLFISDLTDQGKYALVNHVDGRVFVCDEFTWDEADNGRACLVVNTYDEDLNFYFIEGLTNADIAAVEEYKQTK